MSQIIFVVEKPNTGKHEDDQRWRGCTSNLADLARKNKEIQLLGENVLLIELNRNLNAMAKVIPEILGLDYKYQVLSEDIKWTEVKD